MAPLKQSAGTLLYRRGETDWEVLLVHPSGNYNRRAPWSIPKGLPDPGEDLETAARRETREETGIEPGRLEPLGSVRYRCTPKEIHAFAGPAPPDAQPRCASWEVDRAEFLTLDEAERRIHPDQRPLVARLRTLLDNPRAS